MSSSSSGLTPVYIGDVEDPATYWITPERSFSDPNVSNVLEMEQWLSDYCESTPTDHQVHSTLPRLIPHSQMIVLFSITSVCWSWYGSGYAEMPKVLGSRPGGACGDHAGGHPSLCLQTK